MGKFVSRSTLVNGNVISLDPAFGFLPGTRDLSVYDTGRAVVSAASLLEGESATQSSQIDNVVPDHAIQRGATHIIATHHADRTQAPLIRHIVIDPRALLVDTPTPRDRADTHGKDFDGYALHADRIPGTDLHNNPHIMQDEDVLTVTVGGTVSGMIDFAGDEDAITVSLTAGQTYSFYLYGSGGTPISDSFLEIRNPGGTLVAQDDDGGIDTYSMITITATTTGTYTLSASSFSNPGDPGLGEWTLAVHQQGLDEAPSNIIDAPTATLGHNYGFLQSDTDQDFYAIHLDAGFLYNFAVAGGADYNTDFEDVPAGELDTVIRIYDGTGTLLYTNDDIDFPSDISSALGFLAEDSGTYYVKVSAYAGQTGGYVLDISQTDISTLDPLDAIDWGGPDNVVDNSHTLLIYFATQGETYDGVEDLGGWTSYLQGQALAAFQTYSQFANLTFAITTDQSQADFTLVTTTSDEYLAYFNPPGETNAGVGVFAINGTGWDPDGSTGSMEPGGYGWITFIHEFGHGLGMAHPHDNGGGSDIIPGVTGPFGSYGIFDLNQGVYTTMSYNDGWQLHPEIGANGFPDPDTLDYGYQAGPMALDIALMQIKYGAVAHNAGTNYYQLNDQNVAGTYYQTIWDTGGTDVIFYKGDLNVTIDLTAATLDYSATGAGVVSYIEGVFGGYTIANGVVIENASGGSGDDVLLGNEVDNDLNGGDGNDILMGRGGNDTLHGGDGANTAVFSGNMADYIITDEIGSFSIVDGNLADGDDGTDTLHDITYLQFADGTINLFDTPGNQAPSLDDLSSDVTFDENVVNGGPQLIDSNVTFADSDGNFDGGNIRVTGMLAEDTVGIRNEGTGTGQIGTSESHITYGGVLIGQYSGGIGGTLVITLNAAATTLAVEALLENLTYSNASNTPTEDRTLTINVTDSDGASLGTPSFTPGPFVELTGVDDPLAGLPAFGTSPMLAFVDVNHDGDIDIVVGDADGKLRYFEHNDGGAGYVELTGLDNPFDTFAGTAVSGGDFVYSSPATIDIDGDGDLDLVIGGNYGYFDVFQNNGDGSWSQLLGAANPLDGVYDPNFSDPTAIDYDGDGDIDIVSGSSFGDMYAIRNDGGGVWTFLTGSDNPFGAAAFDVGNFSSITSGDVDGDGDLDLVVGERDGVINVFLNQGGGSFLAAGPVGNPWSGIDFGSYSLPAFGDIDGDGDLDLIVADGAGGDTRVWLNTSTSTAGTAPTVTIHVTAQNDAPAGIDGSATLVANSDYTFEAADFDFTDAEGNALAAVLITTLPTHGTLFFDGDEIRAGTLIGADDIGLLVFVPDADESGPHYADFTFQVVDDGRTDNGGENTDQTPNTFSFNVTPDNTAPTLTGVDTPVTFLENTVNAGPQLLEPDVVFSDAEGNFDGGTLTVSGLLAEDSVGIMSDVSRSGAGVGDLIAAGGDIIFDGVFIGTYTGGNAGVTLTVTFNADASVEAIEALIQHLTYANSSDTPTETRELVINVTDDKGLSLLVPSSFTEHAGDDNFFDGFVAAGNGSMPTFVDVNGDGTADLVIGSQAGGLEVFISDGDGNLHYATPAENPFDGFYAGTYSAPAAIDIDGDGDQDLVVGSSYGDLLVLLNDGAGGWTTGHQLDGMQFVYAFSTPTVVDLDGDGLDDLVVGSISGYAYGFHNNGDGSFTQLVGANDPFLAVAVPYFSAPAFVDLDGDGDMDLIVGDFYGGLTAFTNDNGTFVEADFNPFDGFDFASIPGFTFFDVDGDGDLDGVAGSYYGDIRLFENTTTHGGIGITVNITPESDGVAPTGTDGTVGVVRSSLHTMTLAEFGFADADDDEFSAVTITTLPTAGRLFLNGVKLTAGQVVSAADIASGNLTYQATNTTKGSFTFQVADDSGGIDATPNTLTLRIVNAAPTGTSGTVGVSATANHVVTAAEFGFGDIDGNSMTGVTITTLPAAGRLYLDGVKVLAGQVVSAADIAAGKLVYRPAADATGGTSTGFTFQVHDNGGTALGGLDTDQSPNTLTYYTQNRAPDGGDNHIGIAQGVIHTISTNEFGFSDVDGNGFASVTIMTLPTSGRLLLDNVKVTEGQVISVDDIANGKLVFRPASGGNVASFTFQVHDNGGSAYGGTDTDASANTLTLDTVSGSGDAHGEAARVVFTVGENAGVAGDSGIHGVIAFGGSGILSRPSLHSVEDQASGSHFDHVIADLLGSSIDHDLGSLVDTMMWDRDLTGGTVGGDDLGMLSIDADARHFTAISDRGWALDHVM